MADEDFQPAADEPVSAAARLRAFEDATFGDDAVRLHGHVEKGFGSKFKAMKPEQHRHYAALEKLVAAEHKLAESHTALIDAEKAHEAALAEAAESEPDAAPAE